MSFVKVLVLYVKLLIDNQSEFPQLIMKEMQGVMYNSTLSAIETGFNMAFGTIQGVVDHAISPYIGALSVGDFKTIREHSSALAAQAMHTKVHY